MNADGASHGSDMRQLTFGSDEDDSPAWSPDGKKIAFVSIRAGVSQIFVMNANGTNVRQLTNGNADLAAIGIAHQFAVSITAREAGHAKPDAPIFHAACRQLRVQPREVLHVGDDPWLDVVGAASSARHSSRASPEPFRVSE